MIFQTLWTRGAPRVLALQLDQNVDAPWYVPAFFALSAFVLTWLRVETALPLLILATALDRYRFAGAGLRIEHFVFLGVALAWFIKTRSASTFLERVRTESVSPARRLPRVRAAIQKTGFNGADVLLVAYLGVALVSSLLYAPVLPESLKFLALMTFGMALYWFVRALASHAENLARGMWALIGVGIAASAFGVVAWLVFPLGVNLGVQTYSLDTFMTFSPYGTLYDSNTLGMYAMAATLLQATLILDAQFARWRVALSAGLLVTLLAVALSLTRTAWIGLGAGLFLIVLFSPRRRWAFAIGGAAVVLALGALVVSSALAGGGNTLADFSLTRLLTSRSIFFRLDAYTRAWNDFVASPLLGNGANVFAQKYTSPAGARDFISNFVLMTLHDTGIVGAWLLGAWLARLGLETWTALRTGPGRARTFLLALAVAYCALLVTYQSVSVFWLGWNWIYLGLLRAAQLVVRKP